MKNKIEVRNKGKVVNIIHRVIQHEGQFLGALHCRYNNRKYEVKWDRKGKNEQYFITVE